MKRVKPWGIRKKFGEVRKYLRPAATLMLRYYPDMVQVKGGEASIDGKKAPVSAFKMARTETTIWQYALYFRSEHGIDMHSYLGIPSGGLNGDNPVEGVSWYGAARYANWLSKQFNLYPVYVFKGDNFKETNYAANGYRLPTEVEWEYAARGGAAQENFRYSGNNEIDSVGWYSGNSGKRTRPVATKQANNLGLYDMSGNVWEWCGDWHGEYPATFPANYRGQETGSNRVLRGGSWNDDAGGCLPAFRSVYNIPSLRFDRRYGFRLVALP